MPARSAEARPRRSPRGTAGNARLGSEFRVVHRRRAVRARPLRRGRAAGPTGARGRRASTTPSTGWPCTMARVAVAQGRLERSAPADRRHRADAGSHGESTFSIISMVELARAEGRFDDVVDRGRSRRCASHRRVRGEVPPAIALLGAGDRRVPPTRRRSPGAGDDRPTSPRPPTHAEPLARSAPSRSSRGRASRGRCRAVRSRRSSRPPRPRWVGSRATGARARGRPRSTDWVALAASLPDRLRAAPATPRPCSRRTAIGRAAERCAAGPATRSPTSIGADAAATGAIEAVGATMPGRHRRSTAAERPDRAPMNAAADPHRAASAMSCASSPPATPNREIGDQLFISEKTVSVHVSNAMAKLGALSRYEAAAAARGARAPLTVRRRGRAPRAAGRCGTRGTSAGRTRS